MEPLFLPPLHRQRHQFVVDFVKQHKPQKVVDLGCGQCELLKKLKWFHREIDLLVGVDVNGTRVKKKMHGLAPMPADYLQPIDDQLSIELYQGSVTQRDARLRGFDLVTSIELIEHLTPDDVQCFSEVVFGFMNPAAVIISTPNSEFNPLLPGLSGFRHSDHKFEWTRAEFQSWALEVCLRFGFEVEFTGVGTAPSGLESVGFCSQIGVFHNLKGRSGHNFYCDDAEDEFPYTLMYSVKYPSMRDNNILRRVLVGEVLCWTQRLRSRWESDKSFERDKDCTWNEGERGGNDCLSVQHEEAREEQTVCGAQVAEPEFGFSRDLFRDQSGFLSVPLNLLWSHCPKVGALSGTLENLRHLLSDEPSVKFSQDGDAVLIQLQEEESEEKGEEEHDDLEDSRYAEVREHCGTPEQGQDWETNV
ncbi:small RNA 2'-O-methyltransferase [Cynoglossus semilaevis]|uniref:small RNA 2'-O-methyltransferase n=1 Tax=Cynoglossus semilaevis TaxID=244447 RepID=UPI00049712FD|nr:small RNA 2'-O-methyltransferase [Cynoglossus semilaevis]